MQQALAKIKEDILVFIGYRQVNVTDVRITPVQAMFDANISMDEFLKEKIPVQIWKTSIRDDSPVLLFDGVTRSATPVKSKSHTLLTKVTCDSCVFHVLSTTYLSTLLGNIAETRSSGIVKQGTDKILDDKFKTSVSVPTSDFKFLNAYLLERGRLPYDILKFMVDTAAHVDAQDIIDEKEAYDRGVDFEPSYTVMYVMTKKNQTTYVTGSKMLASVDVVPNLYVHTRKPVGYLDVYGFIISLIPEISNFVIQTRDIASEAERYALYQKIILKKYYDYRDKSDATNGDIFRLPLEARINKKQLVNAQGTTINSLFYTYFKRSDPELPVLAFFALTINNPDYNIGTTAMDVPLLLRIKLVTADANVATIVNGYAETTFAVFRDNGLDKIIMLRKDAITTNKVFRIEKVNLRGRIDDTPDYFGVVNTLNSVFTNNEQDIPALYYYIVYIMVKQWNTSLQNQVNVYKKALQQVIFDSSFSKVNTSSTALDYWRHAVMYKIFDFHRLDSKYDSDKIFDVFTLLKKNVGVEILTKHLSRISTSSYAEMLTTFYKAYGYNLVYTFPRYVPDSEVKKGEYQYVEAMLMPEQTMDLSPVLYTIIPSYLVRDYSKKVKLDMTDFLFRVNDRKLIDLLEKQVPQLYSMKEDKIYDMQNLDSITEYTDDLYTEPRIIDITINSAVANAMYEIKREKLQATSQVVFQAATLPDPKSVFSRSVHITASEFYKNVVNGVSDGKTLQVTLDNVYTKTLQSLRSKDAPWIVTIITLLNDYMKVHTLNFEIVEYMVRISLGELKAYAQTKGIVLENESDATVGNIQAIVGTQNIFPVTASDTSGVPLQTQNYNESIDLFRSMVGNVKGTTIADKSKPTSPSSELGINIQTLASALETTLNEYVSATGSGFGSRPKDAKAKVFKAFLAQFCKESGFLRTILTETDFVSKEAFIKAVSTDNIDDASVYADPYQIKQSTLDRFAAISPNLATLVMQPKTTNEKAYAQRHGTDSNGKPLKYIGGRYCKWYTENGIYYYKRLKVGINNIPGMRPGIGGAGDSVHGNYLRLEDSLSVKETKSFFSFLKAGGTRARVITDPLDSNIPIPKSLDLVDYIASRAEVLNEADFVEWYVTLLRDLGYYEAGDGTISYAYGYAKTYNLIDLSLYSVADQYKVSRTVIPENNKTTLATAAGKYGTDNIELISYYVTRYAQVRKDQLTEKKILGDTRSHQLPWGDDRGLFYTAEMTNQFISGTWNDFSSNFGVIYNKNPYTTRAYLYKTTSEKGVQYFVGGQRDKDTNIAVTITPEMTKASGTGEDSGIKALLHEYGPVIVTIPAFTLVRAITKFLNKGDMSLLNDIASFGEVLVINEASEFTSYSQDSDMETHLMSTENDIQESRSEINTEIAATTSVFTQITDALYRIRKNMESVRADDEIKQLGIRYLVAFTDIFLSVISQLTSAVQDVSEPSAVPDNVFSPFVVDGINPLRTTLVPDSVVAGSSYFFGYKVAMEMANTKPIPVTTAVDVEPIYDVARNIFNAKSINKASAIEDNFRTLNKDIDPAFILFENFTLPATTAFVQIFLAAYADYFGTLKKSKETLLWEDVVETISEKYLIKTGIDLKFNRGQYSIRGVRNGAPPKNSPAVDHYLGVAVDIQFIDFVRKDGGVLERFMENMKKESNRAGIAAKLNQTVYEAWLKIALPSAVAGIKKILTEDPKAWSVVIYSRHIHLSLVTGTTRRRAISGKYKGE